MKVRVHVHATQAENQATAVHNRPEHRFSVPDAQHDTRPDSASLDAARRIHTFDDIHAAADELTQGGAALDALPHRTELEAHFGKSLADIPVMINPRALDKIDAEAAATQGTIVLKSERASLHTVAHEVAHVLQLQRGNIASEDFTEGEADSIASRIAWREQNNADIPRQPLTVQRGLVADAVAMTGDETMVLDAPPQTTAADEALQNAEPDTQPTPELETDTEPSAETASGDVTPETGDAMPAAGDVEVPEDELDPPEPDMAQAPEIDVEAARAEQEAARAEAMAALDSAEDSAALMDGFKEAPPSVKAEVHDTMGNRADTVTDKESDSLHESLPEIDVSTAGKPAADEATAPTAATQESGDSDVESPPDAPVTEGTQPTPDAVAQNMQSATGDFAANAQSAATVAPPQSDDPAAISYAEAAQTSNQDLVSQQTGYLSGEIQGAADYLQQVQDMAERARLQKVEADESGSMLDVMQRTAAYAQAVQSITSERDRAINNAHETYYAQLEQNAIDTGAAERLTAQRDAELERANATYNQQLEQIIKEKTESGVMADEDAEPEQRADAIGDNFGNVQTDDPSVPTSAGPPPVLDEQPDADTTKMDQDKVAADKKMMEEQGKARKAVQEGRGPEIIQLKELKETGKVKPLEKAAIVAPEQPVEGIDEYKEMSLEPDVVVAFEQAEGENMKASADRVKGDIEAAQDDRDTAKDEKVNEAKEQADAKAAEADEAQKKKAREQRKAISDERTSTLKKQQEKVDQTKTDIDAKRTEEDDKVKVRKEEDQKKIDKEHSDGEKKAQDRVKKGEDDAEAERRKAEREAENDSWWDAAVDFVKSAFEALTEAISDIFDAVRSAVNGILNAVREAVNTIIDAAVAFINEAIQRFADALKGLVDTLIGDLFPELAAALNGFIDDAANAMQEFVTEVGNTLKEGFNAIMDGLQSAINAILDAFQAAINAALATLQALVTGDWSEIIKKIFEGIMKLAGIDPQPIYDFIASAAETLKIIVDDPGQFLSNVLDAIKGGIRNFANNIVQHLQAGIIGWLTGALGSMNITLPEQFDLWGVLDLVRQILGLTWERLRAKAVRIIGEKNVERIEFFAGYLQTLITGGFSALWEQIKESISSVKDIVFDGIKTFLVERIIMAAITRLATLFNPVGAVVQLVIAIYNFVTFMIDQFQRMFELVRAIGDMIGNIARGVLDAAIAGVENTLAGLLPLAIDLLARLIGLGKVGERVASILRKVQDRIDKAIDKLIGKVMARFTGKKGGTGKSEKPEDRYKVLDEKLKIDVSPKIKHTLYVQVSGKSGEIMVKSEPKTVKQWQQTWLRRVPGKEQEVKDAEGDEKTAKQQELERANQLLPKLDTLAGEASAHADDVVQDKSKNTTPDQADDLEQDATSLVSIMKELFAIFEKDGDESDMKLPEYFKEQLDLCDPDAQKDVFDIAQKTDVKVDRRKTTQKQQQFNDVLQPSDLYKSPLAATYSKFGKTMQSTLKTYLTSQGLTVMKQRIDSDGKLSDVDKEKQKEALNDATSKIDGYLSDRSGKLDQYATFTQSLDLLRQLIVDKSKRGTVISEVQSEFVEDFKNYLVSAGGGKPTHPIYKPARVKEVKIGEMGKKQQYGYEHLLGVMFDITLTNTKLTVEATDLPVFENQVTLTPEGEQKLREKYRIPDDQPVTLTGTRGTTDSIISNALLNSSHLIGDRFGGSGYKKALNIIATSEYYNQTLMSESERKIARYIDDEPLNAKTAELPAKLQFDLTVNVAFGQERFDDFEELVSQFLDKVGAAMQVDETVAKKLGEGKTRADIIAQLKSHETFKRVLKTEYLGKMQLGSEKLNDHTDEIGPDIYLGMAVKTVRDFAKEHEAMLNKLADAATKIAADIIDGRR